MPVFGKLWLVDKILSPIVRPCTRLIIGVVVVPLMRGARRRISRSAQQDDEFDKDIEQWTRGAILLFVATRNFESWLQHFLTNNVSQWLQVKMHIQWNLNFSEDNFWIAAGRLMVAIGVIESMPDQQLFSIIHPGVKKLPIDRRKGVFGNLRGIFIPVIKGVACQHLNRSSPVFAILAVIFGGVVGWVCYGVAIVQYLIIGLVTSRDRAIDVLSAFDRQVQIQREQIIEEFQLEGPAKSTLHDPPTGV